VNGITIYEFDALVAARSEVAHDEDLHRIPDAVYHWLEDRCLRAAADGETAWLRLTQRRGRRVVQVCGFVGVIRAPNGFQIEVLPKVGRAIGGGAKEARQLLIEMLCCLQGFRHVQTDSAKVSAARMPLLEVFIAEFLRTVESIVKRGLSSDYSRRRDNLFALRGKLVIAPHLRQNLSRADRFFTEHDEFSTDRPENRLLHSALQSVLLVSHSQRNYRLARALEFAFADVPTSINPGLDFQRVRVDRGTNHYSDAIAWARLILEDYSPLAGRGSHGAPSLLFPMESVFEAFVAKHLSNQLVRPLVLKTQTGSKCLVRHLGQQWFRLKPDCVIFDTGNPLLVLDTKWKLLDKRRSGRAEKYGLAESDFYQMHAYGHSYLQGNGEVILVYPKTDLMNEPFPVFQFPDSAGMRLWVVPFCLKSRRLVLPPAAPFTRCFV